MNFIPCLAWVEKGKAKSCPDKLELTSEELKNLIAESKSSKNATDSDSDDSDTKSENKELQTSDEEDFDSRYKLDTYDEDGEDQPFMNIGDVAVYVDNNDDEYITQEDAVDEDENEDKEDFIIKATDNLLLVGHIENESSVLEIYVYNKENDELYVHHDIILPAFPLALEWLDFHPQDRVPGNYVAVADMTNVIKIWDLDVVDVLEPDLCLGEKEVKTKRHKDSVISLSWNRTVRNLLASGSADSSIIVWNLEDCAALHKLKHHSDKVQTLQWHPFESSFLLSGSTDGAVKLFDIRSPDAECKEWSIEGEVEKVCWNTFDSLHFFCSSSLGFIHCFDIKNAESGRSIQAHSQEVTSLDMCPQNPRLLVSASMDKSVKVWDVENLKLVKSQKLKVGSIYAAKFAPDLEPTVAVGGNCPSHNLKVIDFNEDAGENQSNQVENSASNTELDPSENEEKESRTTNKASKKKKMTLECSDDPKSSKKTKPKFVKKKRKQT